MTTAKAETKRALGERRARGPTALGAVMGRITRPILGKRGFVGADIITHWATIVGPELAAFAAPMEVKYPRGRNAGATLILRVAHGAAATLLHLRTPAIIERVNRFFGYSAVLQVQAVQGPLPKAAKPVGPPEPANDATSVQTALAKLEAALQRRHNLSVQRK